MRFHDIKACVVSAQVLGARASFFSFLALPDGRTAAMLATPELAAQFPRLLSDGRRADDSDPHVGG